MHASTRAHCVRPAADAHPPGSFMSTTSDGLPFDPRVTEETRNEIAAYRPRYGFFFDHIAAEVDEFVSTGSMSAARKLAAETRQPVNATRYPQYFVGDLDADLVLVHLNPKQADDSIEPFDVEHGTGTGFKFKEYTGEALLFAVRQALHHYMDERIWKRIQLNGMAKDFSWKGPAAEYTKLYEAARAVRGTGEATQSSGKAAQGSGQASRAAGQAARNQKPAGTSN